MTREPHLSDAELLLLVDADLASDDVRNLRAHAMACLPCRRRLERLTEADSYLREADRCLRPADSAFEAVTSGAQQRSARLTRALRMTVEPRGGPVMLRVGVFGLRAAMLAAVLALAAAGSLGVLRVWRSESPLMSVQDVAVEPGALPIRRLTPGATMTLPVAELCRQLPVEPSPVPADVRAQVLRAYGMEDRPEHEYELDYLVTPDLGGAPDARNLWPEPYGPRVWNARVKDELETLLPTLVCEGKVDLTTAQQDIATDWIAAYKKYFGTDRPMRLYSSTAFTDRER